MGLHDSSKGCENIVRNVEKYFSMKNIFYEKYFLVMKVIKTKIRQYDFIYTDYDVSLMTEKKRNDKTPEWKS